MTRVIGWEPKVHGGATGSTDDGTLVHSDVSARCSACTYVERIRAVTPPRGLVGR